MAVFGEYDVACVSVTQNFSTAEAIGRLTLNLGRSRPWRPNDVRILLDTPVYAGLVRAGDTGHSRADGNETADAPNFRWNCRAGGARSGR